MKNMKSKAMCLTLLVGLMGLTACGGQGGSQGPVSQASEQPSTVVSSTSSAAAQQKPKYEVSIDKGDGNPEKSTVEIGTPLTKPADPTAPAGKVFYGWKNTKNGGQIWNFENEKLNAVWQDVALEPVFVPSGVNPQVFEAEVCPDIEELEGATYSGGQQGLGLIYTDFDNEYGTSGEYHDAKYATEPGCFVHYLYIRGSTLTWELESDVAAENVTLFARFGAEYGVESEDGYDKTSWVDDTGFPITVNGVAQKYGKITFHDIERNNQGGFLPLQDFFISASISLVAGKNTIQMTVDNDVTVNGTIQSSAPCVDCIKLYSTSNITWPTAALEYLDLK